MVLTAPIREYPTPKNEQESEDALKGLDSDVTKIPKAEEKYAAPSGDKTNVGSMDLSSMPVQGSREQSGPHEKQKASGEEGVMVEAQEVEHLSGKPVVRLSKDRVTGSVQRKATPGRVHGLNGMLAPGPGRVPLDWDSLEYHNGRPAPVGIRGDPDYDVPPEQSPSTFAVPAKIRATV
ncbi:tRNA dimethylallyltransferase 2 [Dissostichus eleginoides]|uniref:tRNA dimethylallyltransferase 2 n=1 Tax=Dissostichus eleginoides TaxID=100907 RepID=A0AAD9C5U1_DISEL|nr:tRNA dimethylallyltransferase 2 [Dissostichus eleginoides]